MSDAPIDIVIQDKIAPTIDAKLEGIAESAVRSFTAIERVKAALSGFNVSPLTQLATVSARMQAQLNATAVTSARLQTEQQRLQTTTVQTAIATQKLTAESQKTVAANNAAAASTSKLAAANQLAARAQIQTAATVQKTIADQQRSSILMAAAQDRAKASAIQTAAAQQQLAAATAKTAAAQLQAQGAAARAATSQAQLARATIAAGTAQASASQKAALAAAQLARSQAQLATEQGRTATQAANAAKAQTQAAAAALRLQSAQTGAAAAANRYALDAERLKRELSPLYAAQAQFNDALARASGLLQRGAIDQATYNQAATVAKTKLDQMTASINANNAAQKRMGAGSQINRMHLTNLGFQLNDIGVSLASGQNPLLVLIQQGSQISGIASQAGVSLGRLGAAALRMMAPFAPLAAIIGTFVGGLKLVAAEANKKGNLESYAKSLGATRDEIKRLDLDTVTFGDTMRGLMKTINDATGIGKIFGNIGSGIRKVFVMVLEIVGNATTSIVALFQAAGETLVYAWQNFGRLFELGMAQRLNGVKAVFQAFVNAAIDGLNLIIQGLNKVSSAKINLLDHISFEMTDTSKMEAETRSLVDTFVDSYVANLGANQAAVSKFIADWQQNSFDAAKKRIKNSQQNDLDKSAESRATSMAKINAQLDNEIDRMFVLSRARQEQAKFDAIEEQLIGKKITLTNAEATSIKNKIAQIQKGIEVQQEFDSVIDQFNGPAQIMENRMLGISKAISVGAIAAEQATQAIYQAQEAYANFLDPMRQINREYDEQMKLLSLNSAQREVEQQVMQIVNEQLAQGNIYILAQVDALRKKYEAQRVANVASQAEAMVYDATIGKQEQYIANMTAIQRLREAGQTGVAAKLTLEQNPDLDFEGTKLGADAKLSVYDDMYKRLREMRKLDAENAASYQQAETKLRITQLFDKLENTKQFFGDMATLSSSGNKRLFKIGQDAALANAAITGTETIMNAMATKPWYVGAALAIAASAKVYSQIAQIKSAKPPGFANGGSMIVGGGGGTDSQNVRLRATPGEKITVHTPAQARALEKGGRGNTYIYNNSKAHVETRENDNGDLIVMMTDIADRRIAQKVPTLVGAEFSNQNSPVSKGLKRNYKVGANR